MRVPGIIRLSLRGPVKCYWICLFGNYLISTTVTPAPTAPIASTLVYDLNSDSLHVVVGFLALSVDSTERIQSLLLSI